MSDDWSSIPSVNPSEVLTVQINTLLKTQTPYNLLLPLDIQYKEKVITNYDKKLREFKSKIENII